MLAEHGTSSGSDTEGMRNSLQGGQTDLITHSPSMEQTVFEPPLDAWPDAGVYQLRLSLSRCLEVNVGRFGLRVFPEGIYIYTGRASRGLRHRVLRHTKGAARRHWHIDYLLASPHVRLERALLASPDPRDECDANKTVGSVGVCLIPRFGASDCKSGCPSHLWLISKPPSA
jgi:Uri superfamily endonuclease